MKNNIALAIFFCALVSLCGCVPKRTNYVGPHRVNNIYLKQGGQMVWRPLDGTTAFYIYITTGFCKEARDDSYISGYQRIDPSPKELTVTCTPLRQKLPAGANEVPFQYYVRYAGIKHGVDGSKTTIGSPEGPPDGPYNGHVGSCGSCSPHQSSIEKLELPNSQKVTFAASYPGQTIGNSLGFQSSPLIEDQRPRRALFHSASYARGTLRKTASGEKSQIGTPPPSADNLIQINCPSLGTTGTTSTPGAVFPGQTILWYTGTNADFTITFATDGICDGAKLNTTCEVTGAPSTTAYNYTATVSGRSCIATGNIIISPPLQ